MVNCPVGWKNVGGVCVIDADNQTVCDGYWVNYTGNNASK